MNKHTVKIVWLHVVGLAAATVIAVTFLHSHRESAVAIFSGAVVLAVSLTLAPRT